jgi:hypothetical protein
MVMMIGTGNLTVTTMIAVDARTVETETGIETRDAEMTIPVTVALGNEAMEVEVVVDADTLTLAEEFHAPYQHHSSSVHY